MGRHGHAKFSHSNLSNLWVNTGKIQGMRVNIDYSEGVHVTASSPKVSRCRSEYFRRYSYTVGLQSCVVTRSDLMRVSHSENSGTAKLNIH